jgi:hypothetical protein
MSTASPIAEIARSAAALPTSTAECDIGMERNRSVMPRCASVTTAIIVLPIPDSIVIVNMPGSSTWR